MAGLIWLAPSARAQKEPRAEVMPESPAAPAADLRLRADGARRAKALSLFYRAKRLERDAGDEESLKVYLQALETDPSSAWLTAHVTRLYLDLNRFNDALALHEKCVALNPHAPGPLLALSRFCRRHADGVEEIRSRAMASAQLAVEKFPKEAEAWINLCNIYLTDKERDKAQELLKRAQTSEAADPSFWLTLAPAARRAFPGGAGIPKEQREQNLAVEASFYEKALSLGQDTPAVVDAVADFYRRNGNVAKALPLYRRLTEIAPDNLDARRRYGLCLAATDKDEEALRVFADLVRINNQDTAAHRKLVDLYTKKKEIRPALTHRAEVLRLEGGDPGEYAELARGMMATGQNQEALTLLKRGIFHHEKSALLVYLQGLAQMQTREAKEAVQTFARAAELAGNHETKLLDYQFHHDWAAAAETAGDADQAAKLYRKSIDLVPREKPELGAKSYHRLGAMWLQQGRNTDEAGELLRLSASLIKDDPAVLDSLGWFHFLKKDYPAAIGQLSKARALLKEPDAQVLDHLAQATAAAGKPAEAVKLMEKAVTLPGASPEMHGRLEEFRKAADPEGKLKPAAEPAPPAAPSTGS